ncbi:Tim10/DDP family zinc finger-domain-containing protein, partial [Kockovaella imperatae]
QDAGAVDPAKIEMAVAEVEMLTDVFNRLVNSCHAKCIQPDPMKHRYNEGDLLKGESVCIDRCTAKFFEVNKVVGERMQTMGQNAQATGGFGR